MKATPQPERSADIEHLQSEQKTFLSLRSLHWIVAGVHLSLAFMLYAIDASSQVAVSMYRTALVDGKLVATVHEVGQLSLRDVVIAYLVLAAVMHILTATVLHKRYAMYLLEHRNPIRWIEYSISCSLMFVAISASAGYSFLSVLVAMFMASMVMNLLGMVFENVNRAHQRVIWSPFIVGSIIGLLPWLLIGIGLSYFSESARGSIEPQLLGYGFILLIFALFPTNMWLSARRIGPWKSYLTAEIIYIALSLTAKTSLALLIYMNVLR